MRHCTNVLGGLAAYYFIVIAGTFFVAGTDAFSLQLPLFPFYVASQMPLQAIGVALVGYLVTSFFTAPAE